MPEGKEAYLEALLNEGKILNSDGTDAIYEDILSNQDDLRFENAFDGIKDKNILIFAAKYDSVSINDRMIGSLWNRLKAHETKAVQKLVEYPTEHGLLGRRISVIRDIGRFIKKSQK